MAVRRGVDFSYDRPNPRALIADGATFVCRYISDTPGSTGKRMFRAEAERLSAAGLDLVCIWQTTKSFMRGGWGTGAADARAAHRQALEAGAPPDCWIYFAADWDVQASEQHLVDGYLDGALTVLGPGRVGLYGGYWTVSRALAHWRRAHPGEHLPCWQTRSWSAGRWVDGIELRQVEHEVRIGGAACDRNTAHTADFGQWRIEPAGGGMRLVTRTQWGARPAEAGSTSIAPQGTKVHYVGAPVTTALVDDHDRCAGMVRDIQRQHVDGRGWSDIAYNALVCPHGYVFEGRWLHKRSAANGTTALNVAHYAVCALLGDSGLTQPSDAMLHGLRDFIDLARRDGGAGPEIKGHRDGHPTSCPGDPLYAWVRRGAPRPGGSPTPTPAPNDLEDEIVAMTPEDRAKLIKDIAVAVVTYPAANPAKPPGPDGNAQMDRLIDYIRYGDQLALGTRSHVTTQMKALSEQVAKLQAKVDSLAAGGGQVDVTALAKAVADEQHKRLES